MEILLQLGANETAYIQFLLFVITITFLTTVIYNPFFLAYDQRHQLTKGADQIAYETQDEAKKLAQIYQSRAREIHEKINKTFESSKADSLKSCAIIVEAAKSKVSETTTRAQQNIETQKQGAVAQVKSIAEDVSGEIIKKLMGTV